MPGRKGVRGQGRTKNNDERKILRNNFSYFDHFIKFFAPYTAKGNY
jgi:hypothetical protein